MGSEDQKVIPLRWLLYPFLGLLMLAVVGTAAFFIGQGTRKSDQDISRERATAVRVAVLRAVEEKGAEDKEIRLKIMAREKERMEKRQRSAMRAALRRQRKTERARAERLAAQSYSSGNAAGFSGGRTDGLRDGIQAGVKKATDDVVCSDDPDAPLPACGGGFFGE